jgi:hypothetical protein
MKKLINTIPKDEVSDFLGQRISILEAEFENVDKENDYCEWLEREDILKNLKEL